MKKYTRRQMLSLSGQAFLVGAVGIESISAAERAVPGKNSTPEPKLTFVTGEPVGAKIGEEILAKGGNAVDAAIAAGLAACVSSPSKCGIGGYGGHMIIALAGGRKIVSIDFNPPAPAAANPDTYPIDENGEVKDNANFHGWLAAGVPGTLAGFQLALDRFGTRPFRELVAPAIDLAESGCVLPEVSAAVVSRLFKIPPLQTGEKFSNPRLAALLKILSKRNSTDSFYRGDIAKKVAAAFKRNNGLVRFNDLAAYHANMVEPLEFKWNDFTIHTAPLTAGGLTMLEIFSILRALNWETLPDSPERTHARLEAHRIAWKDRLEFLGDPKKVRVPTEKLLSKEYADEAAKKIQAAVAQKKPLLLQVVNHSDEGTVNISAVDKNGNMVAMTLSHGGAFGAQVVVEEYGLVIGHGLSRFVPKPGHPNCIAPSKKPLHNMCPTIVTYNGKPVLAVGAAGGLLIPNSVFNVLLQFVTAGTSMEAAMAAPRLQNTGTLDVSVEKDWPQAELDYLESLGFKTRTNPGAYVSAAAFDPTTREHSTMSR